MVEANLTPMEHWPNWVAEACELQPLLHSLQRYFEAGEEAPVLPERSPAELRRQLPGELPEAGRPLSEVYEQLSPIVEGGARRNCAPGMFGYICGPGLPTDPGAQAWAAGLNQIVTSQGSAPGAVVLERQLIGWMRQLFGFPETGGGLLVSGGSMANLSALAVATSRGYDRQRLADGGWLAFADEPRPIVYASEAAHFSVARALRVLGLGLSSLSSISCDRHGRMDIAQLGNRIAEDQRLGRRPRVVVATAGTTGTGAIDPLPELADLCAERGLHLHVDAAYGGALQLSERLRGQVSAIERADSLCFDLHKWGFCALDVSLLLYRDVRRAQEVFSVSADYATIGNAASDAEFSFFHHGIETSRRARALPVVVALLRYGRRAFAAWVERCVELAALLRRAIEAEPRLEWVAGSASIVCFRYVAADAVQEQIRRRLVASGRFVLSAHRVEGRPVLRVCIVNWATRPEHIEDLVRDVLVAGEACSRSDIPE